MQVTVIARRFEKCRTELQNDKVIATQRQPIRITAAGIIIIRIQRMRDKKNPR